MMSRNTTTTTTVTNKNKKKQKKNMVISNSHLGSGINFIVNFATNTIHIVLLLGCKSLFTKPVGSVTKAIYYTFLSSICTPAVRLKFKIRK